MHRLRAGDVACWLLKTSSPPDLLAPGWSPGDERALDRCVRPSYRLEMMAAGHPCVLWLSGRHRPGVHAIGTVTGTVVDGPGGPAVPVRFRLLADPLPRTDLVVDPDFRDAEVIRMPAGSNPSWLSARQFSAVLSRVPPIRLRP